MIHHFPNRTCVSLRRASRLCEPRPGSFFQSHRAMAGTKTPSAHKALASKSGVHTAAQSQKASVLKALTAKKAAQKTAGKKVARRVYLSPSFKRPKTLKHASKPAYARRSVAKRNDALDHHAVIKAPLTTESAMRCVENENTLVFTCDVRATKPMIKAAVKALYEIDAIKVNTLVTPKGVKKAFVRLSADQDALEAAGKIGFV